MEARNGLADVLVVIGKPLEAEPLLRANVADATKLYGEVHPIVGITYTNLGNALSDIPEKYGEAEVAYLRALEILLQTKGAEHFEVATVQNNLGALYLKTQEWERAVEAYRDRRGAACASAR